MRRAGRAHTEDPVDICSFLHRVREWAEAEPQITAVTLVGSYARGEASPSSDIDLVLLVEEPEAFIREPMWASTFGAVSRWQVESWGRVQSLRVWYENGLEVEFGITDPDWGADPEDLTTRAVLEGGHRLVYLRGRPGTAGAGDGSG